MNAGSSLPPSHKRDHPHALETLSDISVDKAPRSLAATDVSTDHDVRNVPEEQLPGRERVTLENVRSSSAADVMVGHERDSDFPLPEFRLHDVDVLSADKPIPEFSYYPALFTPPMLNAERASTFSDSKTLSDAQQYISTRPKKGYATDDFPNDSQVFVQDEAAYRRRDPDTKIVLTTLCATGQLDQEGTLLEGDHETRLPSEQDGSDATLLGRSDVYDTGTEECRKPYYQRQSCPLRWIFAASLFAVLLTTIGAVHIMRVTRTIAQESQLLYSNGTHHFGPTTILVSFDGLRADYLDRGLTPSFDEIAKMGVQARYMSPSFPSTTFPNHYTLATGLYPESHGIVGNYFWDPVLNDTFMYTDPKHSLDSKWWGGEPIWVTAVLQGLRSAICMWPGASSVIHGKRPSYEIPYDNDITREEKVGQVMEWLDLPIKDRPNFIAVYFQEVDQTGHQYGPDSKEVNDALVGSNSALKNLMDGLNARNLLEVANLVVLSDHGMTQTSNSKLIYLEDWMDVELIWRMDGYPLGGLWLQREEDIPAVYRNLTRPRPDGMVNSDGKYVKPFSVYLRENVPFRFHYSHNARIAPIVIVPNVAHSLIMTRAEHPPDVPYEPIGMHGYDNLDVDMRATFSAMGPNFKRESPTPSVFGFKNAGKTNQINPEDRIPPFSNTEIYALLCRVLGLSPSANNSTLDGWLPGVQRARPDVT